MKSRARQNNGPKWRWPYAVPGSKRLYGKMRKGRWRRYGDADLPRREQRRRAIEEQR